MKKDFKNIVFIIVVLVVVNVVSWGFLFDINSRVLRVVFFDVGQGDAIFIRTPQNHHILIDGGVDNTILEKLDKEIPFFYKNIDLVILSHPHADHVNGLIEVVGRYNVKDIICTGVDGDSGVALKWQEIIQRDGYRQAIAGQKVSAGNFYIKTLYPLTGIAGEKVDDLNEVSVVSKLNFDNREVFLFTGDVYREQEKEVIEYVEENGISLKTDVLKIGHHGSRTSTAEEFLLQTLPRIAIVMVGEDNRYDHPHQEVLDILGKYKVEIKRTDRHGDIIFEVI